jgi:CelD/BcsL family acetyltransferase involved in cellulose biosynthesis
MKDRNPVLSKIGTRALHWHNWSQISSEWEKICEHSDASFFLSKEWVETWLETFGEELKPEILVFESQGATVGACLLAYRRFWRKSIPMRRVYLNSAGEMDSTCIEYNRLMCLPGYKRDVSSAFQEHLRKKSWDELVLAGAELQEGTEAVRGGTYRTEVTRKPSWYVDLVDLRAKGISYESALSSNVRQQIRRSLRLYEETIGHVTLKQAANEEESFVFLDELAALHQQSWSARGKPGVFAARKFRTFHYRLIQRAFPKNRVHLLRVAAGDGAIGLLYNFLHRGRVYFYQSGLAYQKDNRIKPGLVTHCLAINHYLAQPEVLEYDFLAGDSQYKRSLGMHPRDLEWVVVQQSTFRVVILEALRRLRRKYAAVC